MNAPKHYPVFGVRALTAPDRACSAGAGSTCGALLVELIVAMTFLVLGVVGFLYANQAMFRASRDVSDRDLVSTLLFDAAETLRAADFLTLYDDFDGRFLDPPAALGGGATTGAVLGSLIDDQGNPARVRVDFLVNETALPPEFGPVKDLDGDGEMSSVDVSSSYRLLPTRLSLTYQTPMDIETRELFLVLRRD